MLKRYNYDVDIQGNSLIFLLFFFFLHSFSSSQLRYVGNPDALFIQTEMIVWLIGNIQPVINWIINQFVGKSLERERIAYVYE